MTARNGNRSRFHIDRRRKLRHRQRIQEALKALKSKAAKPEEQEETKKPSE
jgi:hypothetical protein